MLVQFAPASINCLTIQKQIRNGAFFQTSIPTRLSVIANAKRDNKKKDKESESPYSSTVKLPTTEFSLRANSVVREPEIQSFWADNQVYEKLLENNEGDVFTLHDGPPYANGDLHIGHALNKVLKDFINRHALMRGKRARFVPGWDTHGLPIELKVLTALKDEERRNLSAAELRSKARQFALGALDAQREQFKRYGVWADWDTPYVTLDPAYEAAQLEVFGTMLVNGHIYRGRKPVHWSPSSRTALAEAELEYPEGHRSTAVYVAMKMVQAGPNIPAEAASAVDGASFAIWTTTPWTIPANMAIAVNDKLEYQIVEIKTPVEGQDPSQWPSRRLIVAAALVPAVASKLTKTPLDPSVTTHPNVTVLARLTGAQLDGCKYAHPLYADRTSPVVIGGDYITTETGTGLVHTAPGHGAEDYLVGVRCGLKLLSPVDDAGLFTEEAGERFKGLSVLGEGNKAVVTALEECGALLVSESYAHKYPYDWRTKKPTIFRATSQWFASVEGFRSDALAAIQTVSWVPLAGVNRITSMTEGRGDWCISRQRKWGVPIPAFYNAQTGEPLMNAETIAHVTQLVQQHGSDAWWSLPLEELLPPTYRHLAPTLVKGEDTMDVWFDSGSSWAGVLARQGSQLSYPADLYLEGSDQHRGWFQSSLLTSVAARGVAPYKAVLTHGFVLDEKGIKMSKSLGNVVDPRIVINGGKDQKADPPYGADVLRMWVAGVDYTADVMIGPGILKQTAEAYRKVRGTIRFLLGNLNDFQPEHHTVDFEHMPMIDRVMLHRLSNLSTDCAAAFENFQFYRIFQTLQRFVVSDLSNFYLDVAKDRLYIRASNDLSRRACQTVLYHLLHHLLACLAPLTPHLAEDAWLYLPYSANARSVFQAGWPKADPRWASISEDDAGIWDVVSGLRDVVNTVLERARVAKLIGSSLDARIVVHVPEAAAAARLTALTSGDNGADELRYLLLSSQAVLTSRAEDVASLAFTGVAAVPGAGDVSVGVDKAVGCKCGRCWNYSEKVGTLVSFPDLCERCGPVVTELGFSVPKTAEAAAPVLVGQS